MNIIDAIHAQFNAYKLPSEYYVKYYFLFFISIATLISTEQQRPYLTAVAVVLYGLNKVIIADLSTAQISTVWRFFRIPILPRHIIAKGVERVLISHYDRRRPDDTYVESRYKVQCRAVDNESPAFIYSTRKYHHAKSLADWLVKRLQIPFEDQVFNPGKLTKPNALDDNLIEQAPVTENIVSPTKFDKSNRVHPDNLTSSMRLPRQAMPYYYVIFVIVMLSIFGAVLLPYDNTHLGLGALVIMCILAMNHYVISLFPVDIELVNATIKIKKGYKRKKIPFTDLMDIAIKEEQLIFVTRGKYYVLPYNISEDKANQVRTMIQNHLKR